MQYAIFKDARYFQLCFQAIFLSFGVMYLHWAADWMIYATYFCTSLFTQILLEWLFNPSHVERTVANWFTQLKKGLPSAFISSFGLTLLLKTHEIPVAMLAASISIASKYVLRFNGKHIFNPSALGIVLSIILTQKAWVSTAQWGSGMVIFFGAICLGCIVVTRVQQLDVSIAFLASFGGLLFARQVLFLGWPIDFFIQSISTGSVLLFSFFMISDPKTTPNHPTARILWAITIGGIAFYLTTFHFINNAPIWVLVCSQPLVPLLDYVFKAQRFEWNNPVRVASKNINIIKYQPHQF
jgi:Na+-transporting NADH:ubiquinone oxidoreductase subunit NqrB